MTDSDEVARTGGCQRGGVRYKITGAPLRLMVCYCGECQRQSGSAFGMSLMLREQDFRLTRGRVKTFTQRADSGRENTGAFCPDCGVRIYDVAHYVEGKVNVKPGTLDDTSWLRPEELYWISRAQPWLTLPADLPRHDTE